MPFLRFDGRVAAARKEKLCRRWWHVISLAARISFTTIARQSRHGAVESICEK
jgi:hypothetical protein